MITQIEPAVIAPDFRSHCHGLPALPARVEAWMETSLTTDEIFALVEKYGSPLNLISTGPFLRNIEELRSTAKEFDVDFDVYFARKANKCLGFVESVRDIGAGLDIASLPELEQALKIGQDPEKIICTAAIKDKQLLQLCGECSVTVAVDNLEELAVLQAFEQSPPLALRLSGFTHEGQKLPSRFGFDIDDVVEMTTQNLSPESGLQVSGIHFHLDGYSAPQRIDAIRQSLEIIDQLREMGHPVRFLDMGGGFPISYLEKESDWSAFWQQHTQALEENGPAVTYRNHPLGRFVHEEKILGEAKTYPFWQCPTRADWFRGILENVASSLTKCDLELRCEPGRAVLDGCGMTVARVEFRKTHRKGYDLVGLSMNRTQCRTSSEDFLVDPLLVPENPSRKNPAVEGYLVGAYCTESEFLCLRRLRFPQGIERGDLVVFPNTAGYFMHFLESRSHQFPLAKNYLSDSGGLDPIDLE